MSNPQSQIPSAQMPNYTTVISQPDGTPSLLFHRFLEGIWSRTGGAQGVSGSDVAVIAKEALTLATTASTEATAAENTATAAQTTANTALADALAAANAAAAAQSTASSAVTGALLKVNNLSDVNNIVNARSNLALNTLPLTFSFDTLFSGLRHGTPIVRGMTIPQNFAGTVCYQAVPTTLDATFEVQVYRAGAYIPVGTIQYVHAGTGYNLSIQAAFPLAAGDVMVVQCPESPDATLAQAAITFLMFLL